MEKLIHLQYKAFYYLYYFIAYSFMGWVTEMVYVSITQHEIASRGFLYGPFCPVYGFGVLLLLWLLQPLRRNPLLSFAAAVVLTSVLEYLTGFALEWAFDLRWWDYSHEFLNLQGRICLKISVAWGLASIMVLNLVHPFVEKLSERLPASFRVVAAYAILFYFVADFTLSVVSFTGLKAVFPIFSAFFPFICF